MALLIVVIVAVCFVIIGAMFGFYKGYDEGFEDALKCYEEEIKKCTQSELME